jgi:dihydroorotase
MIGLETALSVVQKTMVKTGLLNWAQVADRMSITPAKIGRATGQGIELAVGAPANITIYDPNKSRVVVAEEQISKSKNTPFSGITLPGEVRHVFFKGKPTMISTEMVTR